METKKILADGRWFGTHGIGRFSAEIIKRLQNTEVLTTGPLPLSLYNLFWQTQYLRKHAKQYKLFFSPGFNPVLTNNIPYIFTLHDLTHLFAPDSKSKSRKLYYELFIKRSARNAFRILTISDYSKKSIVEWSGVSEDKVINVSCGISDTFIPEGNKFEPGFPYIFFVGNNKAHKNVVRMLQGFAIANLDCKFILSCEPTSELLRLIKQLKLEKKVIFSGLLDEHELANYYRGAMSLVLTSLYEGFGLPVVEAMACGTPVLTSTATSLPEVAGDAALLVDPYSPESIAEGICKLVSDDSLRATLISRGIQKARQYNWDKCADKVQKLIDMV